MIGSVVRACRGELDGAGSRGRGGRYESDEARRRLLAHLLGGLLVGHGVALEQVPLEVVLLGKGGAARAGVGSVAAVHLALVADEAVGGVEALLAFVAAEGAEAGVVLDGVRLEVRGEVEGAVAAVEGAHELGRGVGGVLVARLGAERVVAGVAVRAAELARLLRVHVADVVPQRALGRVGPLAARAAVRLQLLVRVPEVADQRVEVGHGLRAHRARRVVAAAAALTVALPTLARVRGRRVGGRGVLAVRVIGAVLRLHGLRNEDRGLHAALEDEIELLVA